MKVDASLYTLHPRTTLGPLAGESVRHGALLRVEHDNGLVGYGDIFPWPELGDKPLNKQLRCIREREFTPHIVMALRNAREDAFFREMDVSLFQGTPSQRSHYLVSNIADLSALERGLALGYTTFKLKVTPQSFDRFYANWHMQLISARARCRLDFNCSYGTLGSFLDCWRHSKWQVPEVIDWIEDPFPFNPRSWQKARTVLQVKLACDRNSTQHFVHSDAADVWVIKPAIEDVNLFMRAQGLKLAITSYLDHPIGQVMAHHWAHKLSRTNTVVECGLASHLVYEPTSFSEWLGDRNETLIDKLHKSGTGTGFTSELEGLKWHHVKLE